ncbi:hypothetical protein BV22DRAFT_886204 [Leucogyrophana mollusca]|uniref:Uncharacterized protein n=1 Tax=Leucogyrophana mollusca TaxID=85980 RepID=A0ACB8B2N4_9AGAM|nr:hypothetical protein BV22DRAFT_886204 [Leucogyrophana mollusca]
MLQWKAAAPGLFSTIKQAMGFEMSTDDVKQIKGITDSGTNPSRSRSYHTSAVLQATPPLQKPKEKPSESRTNILSTRRICARRTEERVISEMILSCFLTNIRTQTRYPRDMERGGLGYSSDDPEKFAN